MTYYRRIDKRLIAESKLRVGDKVIVEGESGIVRIANGPENTVGVQLKEGITMIDADDVNSTHDFSDKGYMPDFDLDRMMQLAGQPTGGAVAPNASPSYNVALGDTREVTPTDDNYYDDEEAVDVAPVPPVMETDQLTNALAVVEKMIAQTTAAELPDILRRLRAITVYAETMRLGLVAESREPRRSLKKYVAEEEGVETLGADRNKAIDAINLRMGGTPATKAKAAQALDKMRSSGKVKQQGSTFTTEPMDDDTFTEFTK
jgi:hypothetical protein